MANVYRIVTRVLGPVAAILALTLLLSLPVAAAPKTFRVLPVDLGNGYVLSGTIETDGTVGFLAAANITKWNIVVTQTTDTVFTEKNTSALYISMVSTDGKKIYVPASVDGINDGGVLAFLAPGSRGSIPTGAVVADFTGVNVTGGATGWQTPFALNLVPLNQPDGTVYSAAVAAKNRPNVFNITSETISTSPTLMTMFGTVTTDGTIGALAPKNFKSWRIVGREQDIQKYNEKNSHVLNAVQVYSDGNTIQVYNETGVFQIGIPGRRPLAVTLADFTDPAFPGGVASYYYGWQGLVAWKSPLTTQHTYVVAIASK